MFIPQTFSSYKQLINLIKCPALISFIGAGGKTTTMFLLEKLLSVLDLYIADNACIKDELQELDCERIRLEVLQKYKEMFKHSYPEYWDEEEREITDRIERLKIDIAHKSIVKLDEQQK